MAQTQLQTNMFEHLGFTFATDDIFLSQDTASRISSALATGDRTRRRKEDGIQTGNASSSLPNYHLLMHRLFNICLQNTIPPRRFHDNEQFWTTVAEQWRNQHVQLQPSDAEVLVFAFVDARRRGDKSTRTTLTALVELFTNEVKKAIANQVPDMPTDLSNPSDVRDFLLHESPATMKETTAIYFTPVAFLEDDDRQEWSDATGSLSNDYSTADEFIDFARDCFDSGRKELVIGLFNDWNGTPQQVLSANQQDNVSPAEFWVNRCRRRSVVITIHKTDQQDSFQVKLFDPSIVLRQGRARLTMTSHVWKDNFRDRVEAVFRGESWHGGSLYEEMEELDVPLRDEAQLACAFIWVLATGKLEKY